MQQKETVVTYIAIIYAGPPIFRYYVILFELYNSYSRVGWLTLILYRVLVLRYTIEIGSLFRENASLSNYESECNVTEIIVRVSVVLVMSHLSYPILSQMRLYAESNRDYQIGNLIFLNSFFLRGRRDFSITTTWWRISKNKNFCC